MKGPCSPRLRGRGVQTTKVDPDWSRWYADRSDWPLDDELFLAEAVLRFAPMAVFPWLDEFPVASAAAPAPLLPGTLDVLIFTES